MFRRKKLFIISGVVLVIAAALSVLLLKPWGSTTLPWNDSPSSDFSQAPEVRGNSISNSINGAYVAQEGDWVYFAAGAKYDNILHKMRVDGTEKQPINDDKAGSMHVVDGWVYYLNKSDMQTIYKIRTDGSGREKLNDDTSLNVSVVDGWIYYINYGRLEEGTHNTRNYYKVDIIGNNRTKLIDESVISATVIDGWIYYSIESGIYRMRIDGTSRSKISTEDAGGVHVADGWLYFKNGLASGALCRMHMDGRAKEILDDRNIAGLNVYNGWIYYVIGGIMSGDWELYRIRVDGTDMEYLGIDGCYDPIIHDDWIYYTNRVDRRIAYFMNESELWRVRIDGTDNQKVG